MRKAFVSEIFSTIQGEGPYAGDRQIFVRLAGCPLRCDYCDTPDSLTARGKPEMTAEEVVNEVLRLINQDAIAAPHHHAIDEVSITGGEPLSQTRFLGELFPLLKARNLKIYLETAGVHPASLAAIVQWCDKISMDVKLPSATGRSFWEEHRQFLEIGGDKIFVKVVVEEQSTQTEIEKAVSLLSERPHPPLLVLQPVTPETSATRAPAAEQLAEFFALAKSKLKDVFIIPQQHKLWGVR